MTSFCNASRFHEKPLLPEDERFQAAVPTGWERSPVLLWIDDYEPALTAYKHIYEQIGYRVHTALRGEAGLKLLELCSVDAVIVDYEMPGMDGGAVAKSIKQLWPALPVIMFSGSTNIPARIVQSVDALCDKAGAREILHLAIISALHNRSIYLQATSSNGKQSQGLQATWPAPGQN